MSESKTGSPDHIPGFDYLRVAAVFAVVWIHGSDTNAVAMRLQFFCAFAVPCFIAMSVYLGVGSLQRMQDRSMGAYIMKRMRRLFPAYLAWTFIYLVCRYFKHRFISHTPFSVDWLSVIFFGGASYQLWFVPALLVWTVLTYPLMVVALRSGKSYAPGMIMMLCSAFLYGLGQLSRGHFDVPAGYEIIGYMATLSGFVFLGIGLWSLMEAHRARRKGELAAAGHIIAGVGGLLIIAGMRSIFNDWFTFIFSSSVFLVSLRRGANRNTFISRYLSPSAVGVFLSHGIFVEGFQVLAALAGIETGGFGVTVGIIISTFLFSSVLCIILMREKATKWLVV